GGRGGGRRAHAATRSRRRSAVNERNRATTKMAATTARAFSESVTLKPLMIRARTASIMNDIGFTVATVLNQPVMSCFGKKADEANREMKKTGKVACTTSAEPVRRAMATPRPPMAMAKSAATTVITA